MNSTGGVSTPPPTSTDGQGGRFGLQFSTGPQQGQRLVAQQLQAQQQYTGPPGAHPGLPGTTGLGGAYRGAFDQHSLLQHPNAHAVVAAQQYALLREQESQALQRRQQQQQLASAPAGGGMPLLEGPGPFSLPGGFQGPTDPFEQGQPGQHPAYGMMTGRPRFGGFGEPVGNSLRQLASTAQQPSHVGLLPSNFSQSGASCLGYTALHTCLYPHVAAANQHTGRLRGLVCLTRVASSVSTVVGQQPGRQPVRGPYGPSEALGNGNTSQDPFFDLRFENDAVLALEGMDNLSLNPMAEEFVPPPNHPGHLLRHGNPRYGNRQGGRKGRGNGPAVPTGRSRGGRGGRGRGRGAQGNSAGGGGGRSLAANVRRTIYICDIDSQVTERDLAVHFEDCGHINDCRVCGDPNSALRFAFIEFSDEDAVSRALLMTGTMLGTSPLRVLRSKTAIVPVNNEYLPRSHQECELVVRTVYAANIDKKVEREDVRNFFETLCGPVSRLRLLGDYQHATRIAFVEFVYEEGALAALNCSGATLGSLPIRVSPSKTPVRPDNRDDEVDSGAGSSNARRN